MTKRSFRLSDVRPDAKRDVDDEVAFHLEMRTREFIEQGLSPDEAHRRAAASFGDVQSIRSDLRAERTGRNEERGRRDWRNGLRMDVRYSLRALRKNPGFAAAAIATLALGIGATLAVFTVLNGVLLRPLPYKDPSHLALVWMTIPDDKGSLWDIPLTSGFYIDLARDARSFDDIAAFRSWGYSIGGEGPSDAEPVAGARVTPSLFKVLGVRPLLGQPFGDDAAVPGAPHVAMISHALWQRRFGSDPAIVGRQVTLSRESFTIVGVMPLGFAFPRGAELPAPLQFGLRTDVWTPLVFDSSDARNYGTNNLAAIGRRQSAVSLENAEREASGLLQRFLQANAPRLKLGYRLVSMADQAGAKVKRTLLILFGSVLFLLLIACANIASLLVARATGRQRELAVRAALGAGRARIARQLVTENLVLAVAGGLAGVAVSYWGTKVMLSLVPGSMPRADDIVTDWRVVVAATGAAILTGTLFGVASALSVRWGHLASELHSGGTRSTGDRGRRLGRQMLVTGEVALSLVLLIGAALLTRSFVRLQSVQPGFDASHVLAAGMGLPLAGPFDPIGNAPRWSRTLNDATARINASPGVVAAGAISSLPLSGALEGGGLRITGRAPDPPGEGPHAQYNVVSGNYFRALRIPLVAGRYFDSSDDAPDAGSIIVNRAFVRKYFAGVNDALGHTVSPTFTFKRGETKAIVGIVDDVKQQSLDEDATPQVYVPQSQMAYPGLALVVRVKGDPLTAVPLVRRELRAIDPAITVTDVRTMQSVVDHSLERQRFNMTLIGVFAGSALVLALVGLYGVIALIVAQRRREIGVRLALGARPTDVVRMVLMETSRVGVAGVVLGILAAFAITRVMQSMLYGVSTTDVVTFAAASAVVLSVSVAAGLGPARRASQVDPTVTLRAD